MLKGAATGVRTVAWDGIRTVPRYGSGTAAW